MKINQKGFSVVEILVVVVIVGLLGAVGWLAYDRHKNKTDNTATATTSTTPQTTTVDPYKDWQSYCDTRAKSCFKYPKGWNLEHGTSINTQLNSPDATLAQFSDSDQKYPTGQYAVQMHLAEADSAYGASAPFSFTTESIEAVTGDSRLKVVGGYVPSANVASYSIVDTAFIQRYGLAVGKTSQNVMNLSYTNSPTSSSYAFFANDASLSGRGTAKNVTDWFASDYGHQALLILKSYTAQ